MILALNETGHTPTQIFTISLMLIGLLIVGCVAVMAVKRRLRTPDHLGGAVGFTLSDLRQMRKTGQLSDEEFEKAKEKIVETARQASERDSARRAGGDLNVARHRTAEAAASDGDSQQQSTDADDDLPGR